MSFLKKNFFFFRFSRKFRRLDRYANILGGNWLLMCVYTLHKASLYCDVSAFQIKIRTTALLILSDLNSPGVDNVVTFIGLCMCIKNVFTARLTLKQQGLFFQNVIRFSNVFNRKWDIWYKTAPLFTMRINQHCGYWWPVLVGVLAPKAVVAPVLNKNPCVSSRLCDNTSPPGQNGSYFADGILKCIFMNEKSWILIRIFRKFVPESLIDNKSALIQVMAWRRTGGKPLPKPMLSPFIDAYMRH